MATNSNARRVRQRNPTDLLSVTEAAQWLGVRPATLRAWTRRGDVASYRVGIRHFYSKPDLEGFLASKRVPANKEGP
jgi:excisionase family DNA binding protein